MSSANVTPNALRNDPEVASSADSPAEARFYFALCQQGVEPAIKASLMEPNGPFRLAFSRPGLLTFKKIQPEKPVREDLTEPLEEEMRGADAPAHCLIRQSGLALGQLRDENAENLIQKTVELVGTDWEYLHICQRDARLPGDRGFEPGQNPLTELLREKLLEHFPKVREKDPAHTPALGSNVLDVVVIEPNHWLIGSHVVQQIEDTWPGGKFPFEAPQEIVSRAYLKMAEGLAWSELPIQSGDKVVEIGSSPGGASQRLLDLGLEVTGVDPAEMDARILKHPRFEHWRSKSAAIKRVRYGKFQWLTTDANVAPNYTLDVVEDIVNYKTSRFQGLLLTFKLTDLTLVGKMDEYLDRIRSWGFAKVKVRQLASNRRECCVAASRT